ncbi:MAG: Mannose-6-phosphate isomerase, class [Naasia sp.]|nr:Mannose-6-phosphate isomerase, class [Naasia sp.]
MSDGSATATAVRAGGLLRIDGARRSYAWGSTDAMARFLGTEPDGEPFAELWLGAHPSAPSTVLHEDGSREPLDVLLAANAAELLGDRATAQHGERLPFLMKLLAPGRPLSMQVHPSPEVAQRGFAAEEAAGVPLGSALRSFSDPFHKPEMVYALTAFEGLVGFREPAGAADLLAGFDHEPLAALGRELAADTGSAGLRRTIFELLDLGRYDLDIAVEESALRALTHPDANARAAYATVGELAGWYPGDAGAVISLLLNRVHLQPGELVFLGDGVPHAYLSGFGLELMANSDNVFRLGLTSKRVDAEAMVDSLDLTAVGVHVEAAAGPQHTFAPDVTEFALTVARVTDGAPAVLPERGPRVVLCTEGRIRVVDERSGDSTELMRGEAGFVTATANALRVEGSGALALAFVPEPG